MFWWRKCENCQDHTLLAATLVFKIKWHVSHRVHMGWIDPSYTAHTAKTNHYGRSLTRHEKGSNIPQSVLSRIIMWIWSSISSSIKYWSLSPRWGLCQRLHLTIDFIQELFKKNKKKLARSFNFTSCYINLSFHSLILRLVILLITSIPLNLK